jgi:hypothetical protein
LQSRKIHLEFMTTPALGTVYIEGICNIYEFDCGELSGCSTRSTANFPAWGARCLSSPTAMSSNGCIPATWGTTSGAATFKC